MSSENKGAKSYAKRDFLVQIERDVQKRWNDAEIFVVDAPKPSKKHNRFFCTFPYPYMNGKLHLGHTFTLAKTDFAATYQKMLGKNVLFPFSFHTTGMPIKACADKLKNEMELYGNPPQFPDSADVSDEEKDEESSAGEPKKFKASKTKAQQKTGKAKYQWEIMRSIGEEDGEIAKFAEPVHWAEYFPGIAKSDLQLFGVKVDWRRSFFTTDLNPYYDAFIRWQFRKLKEHDKIKFGHRQSIYSTIDKQPCADHDRATGEGVQPQEYVAIKMEMQKPYPKCVEEVLNAHPELESRKVVFLAATLRPETMFGQTNFWVHPEATYGLFAGKKETGELYIVSEHSARNMAYQDLTPEFGKVEKIGDVPGIDLIGVQAKSANTDRLIRGLPMVAVSMKKGTGVVTCVPSDAPDDFIAIEDLKNKQKFREKYGVKEEWLKELDIVEIIETKYGRRSAETVCKDMKITSQNERTKLEKAKELVYKEGFYKGIMVVPGLEGTAVSDAKSKIKDEILEKGEAVLYSEPEKEVISRSGDKCVVAMVDQWYLDYGEEEWKGQVKRHIEEKMEFYNAETKQAHQIALDWLKKWACSRSYGLGTYLPWDPKFVIESLSDSTIYMAYYTFAHLLQNGTMDSSAGTINVRDIADTDDFFDYILLGKDVSEGYLSREGNTVTKDLMDRCRNEYLYWYPMDLRISGKDLIQNHLTMCLYNHAAVLGTDQMPRGYKTNGFVLLNGEKMSKQTGNFLTLEDTLKRFGSDATKIGLADGGDTNEDANFEISNADSAVLKLYHLIEWAKENVEAAKEGKLREGPHNFHDKVFLNRMGMSVRDAREAYDVLNFRDALRHSFHELLITRDRYRNAIANDMSMHKDVLLKYVEIQSLLLAPIASHVAEHIWSNILHKEGFIVSAKFPENGEIEISPLVLQQSEYIDHLMAQVRQRRKRELQLVEKRRKRQKSEEKEPTRMNNVSIYFTNIYPVFEANIRDIVRPHFDEEKSELPTERELLKVLKADERIDNKMLKKAMVELRSIKDDIKDFGKRALDVEIQFDELGTAKDNLEYITRCLEVDEVKLFMKEDNDAPDPGNRKEFAKPGRPSVYFS